ncbi:MAG: 2OG-Fe(II) oxygenase [Actinomycetota bacterium]
MSPELAAVIAETVAEASFEEQQLGPRHHRYRERAIVESPAIADGLWDALSPHVAELGRWLADSARSWERPVDEWRATGCNPRSRFYRYHPGTSYAPHRDAPWRPDAGTRSVLTVLVYLPSGDCVGGATRYGVDELIEPADWRIAVFDHAVLHEGTPVERGRKLVLRNDVVATWVGQVGSSR